ncbi:DsbA family protein [Chryseobacterium oryctis]|uniref:DsbA family protein n=1 Tax=Chryseobacterium oryctis TaxID=2952618 RepID=UPI003873C72B
MKIEIWLDMMSPFCYIGKRNFEQALDKLPFKDNVEVEWKSFQFDLTLDLSKTFTTIEYCNQKKGFSDIKTKTGLGKCRF